MLTNEISPIQAISVETIKETLPRRNKKRRQSTEHFILPICFMKNKENPKIFIYAPPPHIAQEKTTYLCHIISENSDFFFFLQPPFVLNVRKIYALFKIKFWNLLPFGKCWAGWGSGVFRVKYEAIFIFVFPIRLYKFIFGSVYRPTSCFRFESEII